MKFTNNIFLHLLPVVSSYMCYDHGCKICCAKLFLEYFYLISSITKNVTVSGKYL